MLPNLDSNNLYTALGLERTASEAIIREQIGALYREALANAEHRELRMRHYYEKMLEVLPRGYNVLLDTGKRARHDAYLDACDGGFDGSFERYLQQSGQDDDYRLREREGLLEVRAGSADFLVSPSRPATDNADAPQEIAATGNLLPPQAVPAAVGTSLLALVIARGVLQWPLFAGLVLAAAIAAGLLLYFYFRYRS